MGLAHLLLLGLAFVPALCTTGVASPPYSGLAQSPMTLDGARARTLPPLKFLGLLDIDGPLKLENTGRYAKVSMKRKAYLRGGPLIGNYAFDRCVIHWGPTNEEGTEHAIQGKKFAAELQLEHYSTKYRSMEEARRRDEGVAIVSVFLKADKESKDNDGLRGLLRSMRKVEAVNQTVDLAPHALSFLGSTLKSYHYLTYLGSSTESPYFETVTWIVFPKAIEVSSDQIEDLRMLESDNEKKKTGNCRELQPVEGREVLYSLMPAKANANKPTGNEVASPPSV